MPSTVQPIVDLYAAQGGARHGNEPVTQLEHALQCAELARRAGAAVELVAAAFLHDVGHLIAPQPHFTVRAIDDLHQYVSLAYLRPLFGAAVLEPIRLHVDAKRYLCHADPGYRELLSAAGKRRLELQGGPLTGGEASAFLRHRFAQDALRLRRWDDQAKIPGWRTEGLKRIAEVLESAAGCHKTAMAGA
jgi:phosphonate degradation associated HDIG domain protein